MLICFLDNLMHFFEINAFELILNARSMFKKLYGKPAAVFFKSQLSGNEISGLFNHFVILNGNACCDRRIKKLHQSLLKVFDTFVTVGNKTDNRATQLFF